MYTKLFKEKAVGHFHLPVLSSSLAPPLQQYYSTAPAE